MIDYVHIGPTTYDEVYKSKPSKSSSQSTFKVPKVGVEKLSPIAIFALIHKR